MDIEKIRNVANLRQKQAEIKTLRDNLYEEFEKDHIGIFEALADNTLKLSQAEDALRAEALGEYNTTGNKAPGPGITVKIFDKLEYPEREALDWAVEHKIALRLDSKIFNQIMKELNFKPEFLTIIHEPQAQIATDLNKALEGKE